MSKNAARGFASGLGVEAGVAFCGKVIFAVAESVPSHVFMERLRTVQSLYAFVASTRDVLRCKPGNKSKLDPHDEGRPIGSPDQQLQELSKLLSTQEARKSFQSAFASWKNFQMALSKAGTAVPEIRVRGSTARSGRHYVPSVDIAQVVASAALDVVDSLPWAKAITVDLDNFNCEVAVLVSGPFLAVGILLTSRPLVENHMGKGRLPKSSRSWMVANEGAGATLRPSTAYILCKMAGARPGDVFADIMGGAGTIPMEAASSAAPQSEERVFALTGDRDSACTETASGNYRRFHRHFGFNPGAVLQWSADKLPLIDGCVDVVCVDMPFGMRCSRPKELRRLYPRIVAEVARVLRAPVASLGPTRVQAQDIYSFEEWQQYPGGRAVLMTMLRSILFRALDAQKNNLQVVSEVQVCMYLVGDARGSAALLTLILVS
eukprot:INCI6212.1.p1 GENE.INCI6212.1~~INCI6212.1.p1  ORF type:complete len:434 (-),score=51.95 INCI6212.1:24-1325(-)